MGTDSPLGIGRMADSDPLADVAMWIRTAVDDIDAMLTGRSAAWNQGPTAVGAGATVSMGSCTIPALLKPCTLHIIVLTTNTAATANVWTLTPDYVNTRLVNLGGIRQPNAPTTSQQLQYFAIPLDAGSLTTACAFTLHAISAMTAARVLTWIT